MSAGLVKFKCGDINQETKMVFWSYNKNCKNGERWISKEQFDSYAENRRQYKKRIRESDPDQTYLKAKKYRTENKEKIKQLQKKWYDENKVCALIRNKKWYNENKDRKKKTCAEWVARNKDKVNDYGKNYQKDKCKNDPVFAMKCRVRARIRDVFNSLNCAKKSKTKDMIGCDWDHLKSHIESMFADGMSWENRGQWHIDHIVPLASAKSPDEVIKLCHYTNLQPLWAKDNLSKGCKLQQQPKKQ